MNEEVKTLLVSVVVALAFAVLYFHGAIFPAANEKKVFTFEELRRH